MSATTYPKATHVGRRLFWFLLVPLGLIVLVVALFGPQRDTAGSRPTPRPAVAYDHGTLQGDATITEGLGNTTADPSALPPAAQQQLQHASDPEFLGELEEHEQQTQQMLGAAPYER